MDYKCIKSFVSAAGNKYSFGDRIGSGTYSCMAYSDQKNFVYDPVYESHQPTFNSYQKNEDDGYRSPDLSQNSSYYGSSSDNSSNNDNGSSFEGGSGGDSGGGGSNSDW